MEEWAEVHCCLPKLRKNPKKRKERIRIGCGAGFGGDRPLAALRLLQNTELDYLVLECLAERTLADRYQAMVSGGKGYDPRISEWMSLLLPLAMEKGVCIVTNMGAVDSLGAQSEVINIADHLGLRITVSVAYEVYLPNSGPSSSVENSSPIGSGASTYLGAAPIVECLEKYKPNVILTSRLADAALFLGPMVYELGWNWNDFNQIAQGSLAGHLLECGCQLTGGYFMHPWDKYRNLPFEQLLELSLPYAEVTSDGNVCVAKVDGSGGILNFSTCAEQLLYEVGDPGAYITPDVVIDLCDVSFHSLSRDKVLCIGAKPSIEPFPQRLLQLYPKDCGWKGWGEISYGGNGCVKRAEAAEFLVKSWMEEAFPGVKNNIISYIIGLDSLKATNISEGMTSSFEKHVDIRLRMDGLFQKKDHALLFVREFTSLYTNGPSGGGGIRTGYNKEITLEKVLIERESIFWRTGVKKSEPTDPNFDSDKVPTLIPFSKFPETSKLLSKSSKEQFLELEQALQPAPAGQLLPLFEVAHCRSGDKGNDQNFSIIPHFPSDIEKLKQIITTKWVKNAVSNLLNNSPWPDSVAIQDRNNWIEEHVKVEIYEVKGISSLNVIVRNILDGGVNCSRRIDRHGKSLSDLILSQKIVLPS